MKAYVITITDFEPSVSSANKCVSSSKKHGLDVEIFDAITPKKNPLELLKKYEINESDFDETYSRKINGICCFLSHYTLWKRSIEENENILILEHDAVMIKKFDVNTNFNMLLSLGKPSYGKYIVPSKIGVNKLVSKTYLPGAHAYIIKPAAAKELIMQSKVRSKYADVFMNVKDFPWIEEYYPWPFVCEDSFTTVQAVKGCEAKHNYNKEFKIIY